jgi:hypothetical protein
MVEELNQEIQKKLQPYQRQIELAPPPHRSAVRNETEDAVRSLLLSVIRRCGLKSCSRLLERDKGDSVAMLSSSIS